MSDAYSEFNDMCDEIENAMERGEIKTPPDYRTLYQQSQQREAELREVLESVIESLPVDWWRHIDRARALLARKDTGN